MIGRGLGILCLCVVFVSGVFGDSPHGLVAQLVSDIVSCGVDDSFKPVSTVLRYSGKAEEWVAVHVKCEGEDCEPSFEAVHAALVVAEKLEDDSEEDEVSDDDHAEVVSPPKGRCDGFAAVDRYGLSGHSMEDLTMFEKALDSFRQGSYYEELFAGLTCKTRLGPGDLEDDTPEAAERAEAISEAAAKAESGRPRGEEDAAILHKMVILAGDERLSIGDLGSSPEIKEVMVDNFLVAAESGGLPSQKSFKKLLDAARIADPGYAGVLFSRRLSRETEEKLVEILSGIRLELMTLIGVRQGAKRLNVAENRISDLEETALNKAKQLYDHRRSECIVCATKSVPVFVRLGIDQAIPHQ